MLATLPLTAGCGEASKDRYYVMGTVTFDGRPVPEGVIYFDPDLKRGNSGVQGVAIIRNGAFDTRDTGRGVSSGPYLARVQGFAPESAESGSRKAPLFGEYMIPVDLPKDPVPQKLDVPKQAAANMPSLPAVPP